MRCYRNQYEVISSSISPLNGIFSKPVRMKSIILERVIFPEPESKLADEVFEFLKLDKIVIINSNLKAIDPKAFATSSYSAKEIDVNTNRFTEDGHGLFPFLTKFVNLEKVDISNNQLHVVPSDAFSRMTRLSRVSIQNNQLKQVLANAFSVPFGSASLYRSLYIDLQSNELTEKSFSPDFAQVKEGNVKFTLNLERNRIAEVEDTSAFQAVFSRTGNKNHVILLNENPLMCTSSLKNFIRNFFVEYEDCGERTSLLPSKSPSGLASILSDDYDSRKSAVY